MAASRGPPGLAVTAAIATWAASYNLRLHLDEHTYVSGQLRRGRWLRTLGFVIPLAVGQGAMAWWGLVYARPLPPAPLSMLTFPSAWATGYLLGAVAAELTRRRPQPRQVRAAILAPRRLSDYLPAWMLWAERAVALAVLALVPLASDTPWIPDRAVLTVIAVITVATLVEIGLRAMVRRPQPLGGTGELAVDDALRSTALHRAAGAGLAALLFLLGNQLGALDRHWWVLTGLLALVCYGLAIGCWKELTSPPVVADPARHRPNAAAADPVAAGTRATAGMILQLDPESPVPPYEQLRSQITTMVATGVLPQGARLPPIRQLARDLGVATATMARVFRELERDQIITTRGRHGSFVLDAPAQAAAAERDQRLAAAAHRFAVQARQLGIDPEQALHQARQALEALVPRAGHA